MEKPKLLVFASGSKDGGGSGFQELIENSRCGILDANIVGVVSNHEHGGVRKRADKLEIPFYHMTKPFIAQNYQDIVKLFKAEWISLSGWLKMVIGLPPEKTINIHPGPAPEYGGKGMHGHHVHEAVINDFQAGKITHSAVTMHFVTEVYDEGPIFFYYPVLIRPEDTPDTIGERVNKIEHGHQSSITNLVIHRRIRLENSKVIVPDGYPFLPK